VTCPPFLGFVCILQSETLETEGHLRRLFSTFAGGWPGVGLLLMRLVAGIALIAQGLARLRIGPPIQAATLNVLAIAAGILLLAGLWTPVSGSLTAVLGSLERHFTTWRSVG
jgi:hypothetical protein